MEDLSSVGASAPADATPVSQDSTPVETSAPETANDAPREDDLDSALAKVFQKATREPAPRDVSGKFAPKNPPAEAKEPAPAVDQPQEAVKLEAQEKPAPISETPLSWSAEMKAKFAALPPDVQQYVVQRDKETHEHISRLGTAVKAIEPIGRLLEQHQDVFRARGMSYEQGVSQLLAAQRALETNPVAAIAKLANVYGVDLGQITGQGANPQNAELLQTVADLQKEISHLKGTVGSRERAEAQQRQQSLEAMVTDFAKGKSDFEELTDDIFAQITALRTANPNLTHQQILEKAYDAARWANPKTRERMLSEQVAEAKRAEEAKKQAEQAKRAAGVNVKGQAKSVPVGDDLDAALKGVWNKNQAA